MNNVQTTLSGSQRLNSINTNDPRKTLLEAPLSRYQWMAIAVTVLLCAMDGFDVLAVTYAASGFLNEWGLSNAELGFALSMGLVGMALGSFLIAPLADIIGRRNMILICLMFMTIGMASTAYSNSLMELSLWRIFTGLGIGAMICIINPLAAEYANARHRDFAVAIMAIGFPIGGTLGGLASAEILELYNWRAIFIFGAVIALLILPLVLRWIPEPIAYMIDNPKPDSLNKVNCFLQRSGHPTVTQLPPPSPRTGAVPIIEIFNTDNRIMTIYITLIYSLYMLTAYFFLSWMPTLVSDLGFSAATAATVAATRDLAGIFGGILLGWAAHYFGLKRLSFIVLVGMGGSLILFGKLTTDIVLLKWTASLGGLCLYGGAISLYAIISRTFATRVRATGTGFVIGVGRVAGAMAPLLGGYLFSIGWERDAVTFALALSTIVGALLLIGFRVRPISLD